MISFFENYSKKCEAIGFKKGFEKSIRIFIEVLSEYNIPEEYISEKLCSGFDLTEAEAKSYLEKYEVKKPVKN